MKTKLDEISERIEDFRVEEHYEPADMDRVLSILKDLVEEVKRVDQKSSGHTNKSKYAY